MQEYADNEAMITPGSQDNHKMQARRKIIFMNSNMIMKVVHIPAVLRISKELSASTNTQP